MTHSERGQETIRHFLDVAGLTRVGRWRTCSTSDCLAKEKVIRRARHLRALSVDSAVAATLVHKASRSSSCCFVDNGLLRYKEQGA